MSIPAVLLPMVFSLAIAPFLVQILSVVLADSGILITRLTLDRWGNIIITMFSSTYCFFCQQNSSSPKFFCLCVNC